MLNNVGFIINNGDIVRFTKSKKGIAAHTEVGKVILARHNVKEPGYYKITNLEEKEKVILCDAERVVYDYYPEITYKEFLDALKENGFKIGFIEDFKYDGVDEQLVFAYDLETRMCIVAETWNRDNTFNSINVWMPGENAFDNTRNKMFSQGNSGCSVFSLTFYDVSYQNEGVLHRYKKYVNEYLACRNFYPENESISLWNMAENRVDDNTDEQFLKYRQKIRRADREDMKYIFEGCKTMLDALGEEHE